MIEDITTLFASDVFSDAVMQEKLPKNIYKALKKSIQKGTHLELDVANVVAEAMKDWAIEKGATHFTHWFQPMTGTTAEKHDSFIAPVDNGKIIMEFSGSSLVKGEPDASSFPSGGLRCTFEARGYTIWDTTSNAFVKDGSLYIPTAFCSYGGESLDKKTPLLRSMQVISKEATRILKLFGNDSVKSVIPTVGPEQEYFLICKHLYQQRPDLVFTGRTLLGAPPPKGQELDDHYFGAIEPKISAFMQELDREMWKKGIEAKTKHNETAPSQYEIAPVFNTTSVATDHNQLTMELIRTIADKHNLVALLHEKPFSGVNGSGKHNNWSLATDTGFNLLDAGETPSENAQFLLFLVAVIKAIDEYQDLLRVSATSAGNDHRLGAYEAPPAIISMFLGEELTAILEAFENGTAYCPKTKTQMDIGANVLPYFPKDKTDRNRTSPFAFTGNKFEFRMLGSSFNTAGPNIVLNTAVADVLSEFASVLEKSKDFKKDLAKLIKTTFSNHKRIVFNGNNYSEEWQEEAKKRGLSNLKSTVDVLPKFIEKTNIELFVKHKVFSENEIHSRYEILMSSYVKTIRIEGLTMLDIIKRQIVPSIIAYQDELAKTLKSKKSCGSFDVSLEEFILERISKLSGSMLQKLITLDRNLFYPLQDNNIAKVATYYRDVTLNTMNELRRIVDELETMVAAKHWPIPTYAELLFNL